MSNLVKRILSSIVFVALIVGPLFMSNRISYSVYGILGLLTLNELLSLSKKTDSHPNKVLSIGMYLVQLLLVYNVVYESGNNVAILATIGLLLLLASAVLMVFIDDKRPLEGLSVSLFSSLYVGISFLGIAYFSSYRVDLPHPWITIALFSIIWINDSAAYLFGRKIGKTKLIERVSPNKTIEGSVSGLIVAMIAAGSASFLDGMPDLWIMLGFGLVCVVFGSLGDLIESRFKRAAGVKDSGVFLPGHGGFLDRFDAMMLAIPAAIVYFELVLPKA